MDHAANAIIEGRIGKQLFFPKFTRQHSGASARFLMVQIVELFCAAGFDPETIVLLREAYEKACKSLHDTGQPDIVTEIIVQRIIAFAKQGERDPDKLCADALRALGNKAVFEK